MKRLPPAKQKQLLGVILATAGLICVVYFLLIGPQNKKNADLGSKIGSEGARLQTYKKAIAQMEATTVSLADLTRQLSHAEEDVGSGDLYAWTYDTISRFKTSYHVEIPTIGQPAQGDCDLIGDFPYRQIRFSLTGTAYYHDLGKFVADFENKYPHCRILNVSADPSGSGPSGSSERLVLDGRGGARETQQLKLVNALPKITLVLALAGASAAVVLADPPKAAPAAPARSVFLMPANAREGRDPFFPTSSRPYEAAIASQTNLVENSFIVKGVSIEHGRTMVIINNHTFALGDEGDVLTSSGRAHLRLAEIRPNAVIIEVNGARRELGVGTK